MPSSERGAARALLELASTASGQDWDESIRHIVQVDAEVTHIERVSFWSLREETASIHCDAGYIASTGVFERGTTLSKSDHPAYFNAILEARIVSVEDVRADPRTRDLLDYCAARGISSMLDIPVWLDGRLAGVLCHEHVGAKRRWGPADEDFATGVGQVVASSLAARARTGAEVITRRAAFLDSVSRSILPSLEVSEIGRRVVGLVVPGLADFAMVWALNADGVLEGVASTHADRRKGDLVHEIMRTGAESGLLQMLLRQSRSLLLPDASPSALERYHIGPAQRDRFAKIGLRTAMVVPLAGAGKVVGLLALFAANRHYRSDDLALAEGVAERIAAALENARLYQIARDAIRARDDFLVLAAHELRTPLTALQLMMDNVRRRGLRGAGAGETTELDALARQVRRLGALVERILDALRVRTESIALAIDSCDLAKIARDRVGAWSQRARSAGCAITVRGESSVVGRWDGARVAQVIDDLLDNAIKFGGGKPVEVTVGRRGRYAVVTVRDHGSGIAADRLASIFSPFERGIAKDDFGGLGLGLFIAKAIVEAHRGSITATSRPGEGTTFIVRLLVSEGPEGAPRSSVTDASGA